MEEYKEMYYTLFNEVTKAIELLQQAQKKAENKYNKRKAGLHERRKDKTH